MSEIFARQGIPPLGGKSTHAEVYFCFVLQFSVEFPLIGWLQRLRPDLFWAALSPENTQGRHPVFL
jgi:hypothetical protein